MQNASTFFEEYARKIATAAAGVKPESIDLAKELILSTIRSGKSILACGNGGSAAIINHMACDMNKGIAADTPLRPRFLSLCGEPSLLTATANDYGYDRAFDLPLSLWMQPGDLLLAVSSSGSSPNIMHALEFTKSIGGRSILLCGFSGGKGLPLADVPIHVPSDNYGIVEDVHQMLLHAIAQNIRITEALPGAELKL